MAARPYLHDMDVLHFDNYAMFQMEVFSFAGLFPALNQCLKKQTMQIRKCLSVESVVVLILKD